MESGVDARHRKYNAAMADDYKPLDTRVHIVTPENIAFDYRVAGPFRRLGAYLLDVLVWLALLVLSAIALMIASIPLNAPGFGLFGFLVLLFIANFFYGGLFEAYWNGQTPGKRMMHIRVISITGQPITGWQAVLRNLVRPVDALPVIGLPTYQVGLLAALMNDRFQRLGDLVCGTMVVVEEPQRLFGVARIDEPEAIRLAGLLPANYQVSRSLARALSNYVLRRRVFPPARRAEIARHLGEPLRLKFNLPQGVSHDMLLCALYHQTFIAIRPGEDTASPFMPPQQPALNPNPPPVMAQ